MGCVQGKDLPHCTMNSAPVVLPVAQRLAFSLQLLWKKGFPQLLLNKGVSPRRACASDLIWASSSFGKIPAAWTAPTTTVSVPPWGGECSRHPLFWGGGLFGIPRPGR